YSFTPSPPTLPHTLSLHDALPISGRASVAVVVLCRCRGSVSGRAENAHGEAGLADQLLSRQRLKSSFDYTDRPHPRHLVRQSRPVNYVHNVIDVLVSFRLFLRQPPMTLRAGDDALRLQL